ncbi:hypothetical protein [Flammeovirga aprica]|uniref:Uncharacterized protein n=1 Tax=Flammeovirga aprica JL-4 TaxID=694437 RepID=A0A7X9XCJ7_9BACT|nr:hypothetical protein [Flammeovirga aprica]NME71803.1 hypothetical protein [Flammeovirga aprica JL-4]
MKTFSKIISKEISLFLILLLLGLNSVVIAQQKEEEDEATKAEREKYEDLDYKKFYPLFKPTFDTRISDLAFQDLKKVMKYQPLELNPVFQVSDYYFQRIYDFDVLREYQAIHSTCDSALRYIELFETRLDEKEVKKKGKRYYMEFLQFPANDSLTDEKVNMLHIQNELSRRKEVLAKQKVEVDSIYLNFKASINEYLIANEIFREVCGTYPTIKELYIMAEYDSLFEKIAPMKEHYQKSLFYFDLYKKALEVHPMDGYATSYTVLPIEDYRIHGLTRTSFLTNNIRLWDYAKWYDDVLQFYKDEIISMRSMVTSYDEKLETLVRQKQSTATPSEERFYLDLYTVGKIKKYDPNAYPVNIYEYKEQKINLLNQIAYSKVINSGIKGDLKYIRSQADVWTESEKAMDRINSIPTDKESVGYKKHAKYFQHKYNDNLPQYIATEKTFIHSQQQNAEKLLKEIIVNYFSSNVADSADFVTYEKDSISLEPIHDTNEFLVRRINTLHVRPSKNDHKLLIGTIKDDKSLDVFVADLDSANNISWVTRYPYKKQEYQGLPTIDIPYINLKGGSLHLMVTVQGVKVGDNQLTLNNKVLIFEQKSGKLLREMSLFSNKYPRVFQYLQEQKSYLVAYKGRSKNNVSSYDTLNIQNIKVDGEIVWNTNLLMQGKVNEILALPNEYLVVANINKLSNLDGSKVLSGEHGNFGSFNTGILKLDYYGTPTNGTVLSSSEPYQTIFALTDYDNTLNLIGVKGVYREHQDYSKSDIMLITLKINNLKVVEKNIQ